MAQKSQYFRSIVNEPGKSDARLEFELADLCSRVLEKRSIAEPDGFNSFGSENLYCLGNCIDPLEWRLHWVGAAHIADSK